MKIINPRELKIIQGLPPVAQRGDKVSIDTEFFGMDKNRLHRPHGTFAYLGCSFDGQTVYYTTEEDQIKEFLSRLDAAVWVFANAKFDIRQLRRYASLPPRRNLWDVILVEQIMYSGYYTDFSLADLVRRYLDTYMPKEERKTFSDGDTVSLTREQIQYASGDVAYTWKVWEVQRKKIDDDDLNIWRSIELPFLWSILAMSGVRMDVEKWTALANYNAKIAKDIQAKYGSSETVIGPRGGKKEVFTGVNLNSPAQVKKYFADCGVKLESTDEDALQSFLSENDDGHEASVIFAADLLTYRKHSKRASTYGLGFIENHVEADGKIYADIYQVGAETGRTSCRTPNLQNQPHETAYRECFTADDGECMIVADWGSQEPRIAAFLSQDEGLMDALNGEEKLYVRVARDILGISITKADEEYKHMKSTVLGIFYGMSAYGLSQEIGVSESRAQEYIDLFLETYPGVKEYMRTQKRAKDYVTSIYGRKIWLNKYSFQWERNALNAPIQGSAADAMKIAAARFTQETYHHGWRLALLVHDEIVIIAPKSQCEFATKVLADVMIEVAEEMHPGIKGSVEIFDGPNWACKH
jgi:DNA polymerase I-like protein with 3'-5' exonuclease and polymerase domains